MQTQRTIEINDGYRQSVGTTFTRTTITIVESRPASSVPKPPYGPRFARLFEGHTGTRPLAQKEGRGTVVVEANEHGATYAGRVYALVEGDTLHITDLGASRLRPVS